MSDFSGLEQSFALSAMPTLPEDIGAYLQGTPLEVQPHELGFQRLRTPQEIAGILHLRQELALPVAALADGSFAAREKKEMN
ncbi:MAG TPA: hypothetical protein VHL79_11315 [Ramlibacter sp.]|jgi:hypothetical protein|nr:hypothetical protein [Ramlibacter sp.]